MPKSPGEISVKNPASKSLDVLERRGLDIYLNGVLIARGIRQNTDLGDELHRGLDIDDEMRTAWEGWT